MVGYANYLIFVFMNINEHNRNGRAWLPSGRASDSGATGPGFDTYLCRVVSLNKDTFNSQKVQVIPDMTEKLLTGTLSLNKTTPKQ